ncbi:hypothetical protein ACHAXH_002531 [Discostella pseudostelligera]|jgi:hypothetical protein
MSQRNISSKTLNRVNERSWGEFVGEKVVNKMRISRQGIIGRRRRLSVFLSSALARARRNGPPLIKSRGLVLMLCIAASILTICLSSFFLRRTTGSHSRWLRSSGFVSTTGSEPTVVAAVAKRFSPSDYHRKHLIPPKDTNKIIFYNLYIPDETEGVQHVIEVVNEQLGQVSTSLKQLPRHQRRAVVFYNVIGNASAFSEKKMKRLCNELKPKLHCKQIGHYEVASESVTLQEIYDYCQDDDVADARVTYLHAKGSYHQTVVNTNWRRTLTDAVVHRDCLFPPDDQCNVCGAQFYTRFATMFPGNMWTAKCSYIKQLLPPLEGGVYDKLKNESIIKFLKYRLWGQLKTTLLKDRVDYFGLGRYRLEHWIGSHPSIVPCELHSVDVNLESMIIGKVTPDDYDWGMGPRREDVVDELKEAKALLKGDEDAQFREYFFLPGNLLKWFTLYGSKGIPEEDSWQWDFFPGGERWKVLVDEYKENAVEEMVMQSSHEFHSAFVSENDDSAEFEIDHEDEALFSESTPPLVVFYHIAIPEDKKLAALHALKSQLNVLSMGQYDIISRSYRPQRPVIIYYSIAGDSHIIGNIVKNVCESTSNLTCHKLSEFESPKASGETLQRLHSFCVSNPSQKVTYLSNQLPGIHGDNSTEVYAMQKIRAYTTAVTSNMCLKSRDRCNVCGTEFYPLPYNHFIGNMFTATCEYVKELLPPKQFERDMNDLAGDTLVSQLRRSITTELFEFTPQTVGLDQYSVEHWIGSHPDLEPCDVAPVRYSWFPLLAGGSYLANDYSSSRSYDFIWADAPRRSSAPGRRLRRKIERTAMEKDEIAFREYYYLAGNLFRWHRLYGKSPPWSSWVWQWYPRGDEWMQGTKMYGSDVVTKLSRPYWDEGVPF